MISIRIFLIMFTFSTLSSSSIAQEPNISNQDHHEHAQEWTSHLIRNSEPKEIQLVANILYLLYSNAIIDVKIRQFVIPITRLNQSIRSNIVAYKNTAKELSTLKTLLDRLSLVIGARTVYNQKLKTCLDYYNNNQTPLLTQSIVDLQAYGQISLNEFAQANTQVLAEHLKSSAETLKAGIQPLQEISNVHAGIADGSIIQTIAQDEATKKFAALVTIDGLLKNNLVAIENTEYILNTLDASTDIVLQLISSATEIYYQHYKMLYEIIASNNFDTNYAHTLFGMNDLLPNEYKSLLPHPDNVFEHVLQTIKLYTQMELIK